MKLIIEHLLKEKLRLSSFTLNLSFIVIFYLFGTILREFHIYNLVNSSSIHNNKNIFRLMLLAFSLSPIYFTNLWRKYWNYLSIRFRKEYTLHDPSFISSNRYVTTLLLLLFFIYIFLALLIGYFHLINSSITYISIYSLYKATLVIMINQYYLAIYSFIVICSLIKRSSKYLFGLASTLFFIVYFTTLDNLNFNDYDPLIKSNLLGLSYRSVMPSLLLLAYIFLVLLSSITGYMISFKSLSELKCQKLTNDHIDQFNSLLFIFLIFLFSITGFSG